MKLSTYLILAIIALHLWFLVVEVFFWTKPFGRRLFKLSEAEAKSSAKLAANQGLYNGFLATGLAWSLGVPNPVFSHEIAFFFLDCIMVAGIFGAATVSRKIFLIQALPAIITISILYLEILH